VLLNVAISVGKEGRIESEPRRTRTSNRLIKSDEPSMLLDSPKGNLISSSSKISLGYYLADYLVPYGISKFVGKMLAKLLLFVNSVNQRKNGIQ